MSSARIEPLIPTSSLSFSLRVLSPCPPPKKDPIVVSPFGKWKRPKAFRAKHGGRSSRSRQRRRAERHVARTLLPRRLLPRRPTTTTASGRGLRLRRRAPPRRLRQPRPIPRGESARRPRSRPYEVRGIRPGAPPRAASSWQQRSLPSWQQRSRLSRSPPRWPARAQGVPPPLKSLPQERWLRTSPS